MINHITFIGSGNVATHLAAGFYQKGLVIDSIYSRSMHNAKILGKRVNATWTNRMDGINTNSDLYLICLPDHLIDSKTLELSDILNEEMLVVHASGSVSSAVFNNRFKKHGVFYPLQSFSKEKPIALVNIPFCITASNQSTVSILVKLAKVFSENVHIIDDEQRLVLHIAAVFSNNFSNFLFQISNSLLRENKLDFDLLRPLIRETAFKVMNDLPELMQTGPAIRKDDVTLKKHTDYLSKYPAYQKLYQQLTKMIIDTQ